MEITFSILDTYTFNFIDRYLLNGLDQLETTSNSYNMKDIIYSVYINELVQNTLQSSDPNKAISDLDLYSEIY